MKYYTLSLLVISLFIFSCSDDRVEEEKNAYASPDPYFDSKKEQEQTYTIDSGGTCPLQANRGTRICPVRTQIQTASNDSVSFPFQLHIKELYQVSHFLYERQSMIDNSGNLLAMDGAVRIRASKNGSECSFYPGGVWNLEMPEGNVHGPRDPYTSGIPFSSWVFASNLQMDSTLYGNESTFSAMGWLGRVEQRAAANNTTVVNFTSGTDILDNVAIFVYITDRKSLVYVENQTSSALPVGSNARVLAIGRKADGSLYRYEGLHIISQNMTIDFSLSPISDNDLSVLINSLN